METYMPLIDLSKAEARSQTGGQEVTINFDEYPELRGVRGQIMDALENLDRGCPYAAQTYLDGAKLKLDEYLAGGGYRKGLSLDTQKMLDDITELAARVGMAFVSDPEKVAAFEAAQKRRKAELGIEPFMPGRYLDGLRKLDREKRK